MTNAQSKMINEKFQFQFPKVMLFTQTTETELRSTEQMSAFIDMTESHIAFGGNFQDNDEETGEELRVDKEFFEEFCGTLVEHCGELIDKMMISDPIQHFPQSNRSFEECREQSVLLEFGEGAGLNKPDVCRRFLVLVEQLVRKMRGEEKPNDYKLGGLINTQLELLRITGREISVTGNMKDGKYRIALSINTPKEYRRVFGYSQTRVCENCEEQGKGGVEKMKKCGGCNSVRYCSLVCQKEHWKSHKTDCKRLQPLYQKSMETTKNNKESMKCMNMNEC